MAKPLDASELGRQMNALRKHRRGGGEKPRTVVHEAGLPIGSRDTVATPYKRYVCVCVDCRIARGHKKPYPGYEPPDLSLPMTPEARAVFTDLLRVPKKTKR